MGNIAISVENLGKRYRIGHAAKRPDNLREAVRSFLGAPFHYLQTRLRQPNPDELMWALKDVSFEVKHGEVLGIIGRNGAGKSTLLKILSRITEPSTGRAIIYGRVGSLLEVGTGFHPELTGRENVYLNGAILGMRRSEIDQSFDEIVAFSGVERFLDTPVKRYSSGMYVRLAFAVAAHLKPDILIVDEVLAVGDAEFQKKCLGKMGDVSTKEGRTVLFVSHNMMSVAKLCKNAILLSQGHLQAFGGVNDIIAQYETDLYTSHKDRSHLFPIENAQHGIVLENVAVSIIRETNHAHLRIEIRLKSTEPIYSLGIRILIYAYNGFPVAKLGAALTNNVIEQLRGTQICILEGKNIDQYLISGDYSIGIELVFPRAETLISVEHVATFQIPMMDVYGTGIPCDNIQHGIVPLPIKLTKIQSLN